MRLRSLVLIVFVLAVSMATSARAQDKPVSVNLGAGYTFSLSDVRDHLGDGYNVNFGLTFRVTEKVGIQGEYSFNGLGEKRIDLPAVNPPPGETLVRDVFADMNMQYGNANLVFRPKSEGRARPFIVAGFGLYYRPVKVTTPGAGYIPPYCDPWWYVCYPGGVVPVDYILAEKSSTDVGIDIGGGVDFMLSDDASFYVEARYHYIWGPELKNAAGASQGKANGQFLPLTFGFRF
jgi:opacity protein-like surface antigen